MHSNFFYRPRTRLERGHLEPFRIGHLFWESSTIFLYITRWRSELPPRKCESCSQRSEAGEPTDKFRLLTQNRRLWAQLQQWHRLQGTSWYKTICCTWDHQRQSLPGRVGRYLCYGSDFVRDGDGVLAFSHWGLTRRCDLPKLKQRWHCKILVNFQRQAEDLKSAKRKKIMACTSASTTGWCIFWSFDYLNKTSLELSCKASSDSFLS